MFDIILVKDINLPRKRIKMITPEHIKHFLDFPNKPSSKAPFYYSNPFIYHYTKLSCVDQILLDGCVRLRLTEITDFSDKFEGKIITQCYPLILDSLLKEQIISLNDYFELSEIKFGEKRFFPILNNQKSLVLKDYYVFVLCFSKNKNDPYMFEHFSKENDELGICIELTSKSMMDSINNTNGFQNISSCFSDVVYKDDIIPRLENEIKSLIWLTSDIENANTVWRKPIIQQMLTKISFLVKNETYRKENESRLIVFCPTDYQNDFQDPYLSCELSDDKGNLHFYLNFSLPVVRGYSCGDPTFKQTHQDLFDLISSREYDFQSGAQE